MSKLIYTGKTKDVFDNADGTYTLKLKDDATGKDGVFDPGENAVGLSIAGLGLVSLRLSSYYFELLQAAGIPTHYLGSDFTEATMRVLPGQMFGKGVEFICRRRADGSFVRRYGAYITAGTVLDYLVEVTLKDDTRGDPPIIKDALCRLGIMSEADYERCKTLTQDITKIIAEDLHKKGLELYDIKFEFGKHQGEIILVDEVSAGSMRAYKDGIWLQPMDLARYILGDGMQNA